MRSLIKLFAVVFLISSSSALADECKPIVDFKKPQYIVAYGSLLNDKSKLSSAEDAGYNIPIKLKGYKRSWNHKETSIGYTTTFLGANKDKNSSMNAAIFRVFHSHDILKLDKREKQYCRIKVFKDQLTMLDNSAKPYGEIWIYASSRGSSVVPGSNHPIVQSYVDIFLEGCINIGKRFELEKFAEECITSTHSWSKHWINDRLYPRRAFIYQKKTRAIDEMLNKLVPEYFKAIKIEG